MRRKKERGASLVEYSLLVALVALVTVGATRAVGSKASETLDNAKYAVAACSGASDPNCASGQAD